MYETTFEWLSAVSYLVCAALWGCSAWVRKPTGGKFFPVLDSEGHTPQSRKNAWLNFSAALATGLGALFSALAILVNH